MRILLEALFFGLGGLGAVGFGAYYVKSRFKPSSPELCKHKRWSPWTVVQSVPVYLYSEVDDGRKIPDRVDVQMTRECRQCGIPQAKTVRGIDSVNYK